MPQVIHLPIADRVQGVQLERFSSAENSWIALQYTDPKGQFYEIRMWFLDAMYLRNMLNAVESDAQFGAFDGPKP